MLGRKTFLIYTNRMISAVTGAVGLFFIARFMENPTYNYGIVSFALGFVSIFTIISGFFSRSHMKRISGKEEEAECMGTFLTLNTLVTSLMVIFFFVVLWIWQNILNMGFQTPIHRDVLYIILLFVTIKSLCSIAKATFIGKGEIAKKEVLGFADQSVPTILIIYVAYTGGGAIELALTYVVGALLMALLGVYFLIDIKIKKPNWRLVKRYWDFGWPNFLNNIFNKFGNKVDIVLIQVFWSSVNVGYYAAARKLSLIITGMAVAITTVLFPAISNLHSENKIKSIKNTVKGAMRYISMLSLPVIVFMIVFPGEIIHILLSNKFLPAVPVFRVLAFQAFLASFFRPINQTIPGIDKPKLMMKIGMTANGINIFLNIILIPDSIFGIPLFGFKEIGAASATLTAVIISSLLGYYYVNKLIGIDLPLGTLYHLGSATVSSFILFNFHKYILPITRIYHLIGYGLAMLGIYTALLYVSGEFTKQDWNYIMDIIHPGEMWKYIKEELTGKK